MDGEAHPSKTHFDFCVLGKLCMLIQHTEKKSKNHFCLKKALPLIRGKNASLDYSHSGHPTGNYTWGDILQKGQ